MNAILKILHLEDSPSDANLVNLALKKGKIEFERLVVDTRENYVDALSSFFPDIVLSDHSLPSFNSHEALTILQATGRKVPFILITANISEEFAVDVIKRGADDYILKDRLQRLPSAIHNSLEIFRLEKERLRNMEEQHKNEKRFRALIENIADAIILINETARHIYVSPSVERMTGYNFSDLKGKMIFDYVHPEDKNGCLRLFELSLEQPGVPLFGLFRIRHLQGHFFWTEGSITNLLEEESINAFIVNYRDVTKRKNAEDGLKESEFRYRQIVETAHEGIWVTDENSIISFVNKKMCAILGHPKREILGKEIFHFMDAAGRQSVSRFMKEREKGIVENLDVRYITGNGKWIWTNLSASLIYDELDRYKGILAMVSDISEKRNLEDLLNRVNSLARIGNWEADLLKNTVYWSEITRQMHEVDQAFTASIATFTDFFKEGVSRDAITLALKEAVEHGNSWDLELQLVTAKANECWVRAIGAAEFINGQCVRLFGSFHDIDLRKKAELEVLSIYKEKNIILESIGDAFFAADKNWIVTYWNKEAEKLLGKQKNEIEGLSLWETFTGSLNSKSFRKFHEAMETRQLAHFEDYFELQKKWYEISAYPSESGLSVYLKDITERKLSEIQLDNLNKDIQKNARDLALSNTELERFAYIASHDLQEPLRMVTSFLTQIEKKYVGQIDEKGKQYIHFAVDGAKRMRQIILDLLEFSRVGRPDENLETVDVQELLNEILPLYRRQIEDTKALITTGELPQLRTFRAPLGQVFQNLLSNALKYHKEDIHPEIFIRCKKNGEFWQFEVRDNGIGMESEYFDKIFIIFQRLHNKDEYSGSGLGLAICKKIITHIGGKIWVEAKEGIGSCFFFTIPIIT